MATSYSTGRPPSGQAERLGIVTVRSHDSDVLRGACSKINVINDFIKNVARNMIETMIAADGVGLAANQVGFKLRMFVMRHGNEYLVCINPRIVYRSRKTDIDNETCLSVPNVVGLVERNRVIKLEYLGLDGVKRWRMFSGLPARIVQHEMDHLNGILFTDRVQWPKTS